MAFFKIHLAGKNIAVTSLYDATADFCSDYTADFQNEDFAVSITEADIISELERSIEEGIGGGMTSYRPNYAYLEVLALYRKIAIRMADYGVILFHGSAIELDGVTYIFTAKSGTGKSTHTRLWREHFGKRAVMVNDDKPLIHVGDGAVTVYGTPWNGKHNLGENMSSPLHAICILERAEKNSIVKVDPMSVFVNIFGQTFRPSDAEPMKKVLVLVDKMLKQVPVYRLGCNMDPDAVEVSYNGMKGNNK